MRDSRVSVWTATTFTSSTAATNGPTIDLLGDYTWNGNFRHGTSLHGVGVEIMASSAAIGNDADGFTLTWKWQTAPSVAGVPGAWVDAGTIGVLAYDETNGWTVDGTLTGAGLGGTISTGLTRAKLSTRLRTNAPYARLVCTPASVGGTASVLTRAFISDGTNPYLDNGVVY